MPASFADRLAEAVLTKDSRLVVGIDPDLARIPRELHVSGGDPREDAAATFERFSEAVVEAVAPHACAVKPQIAHFEAWGSPGVAAFEATVRKAREAGLLVIGDVKRGDIGSTAAAYARGLVEPDDAPDALTLNPYLGTDSIRPFLEAGAETGRGCFILVRTSNPSAAELQDLVADGRPIHHHVAELVTRWGADAVGEHGYSSVGAVVGATAPEELATLRGRLPHAWLLIPGVGAQGATAQDVACAFDEQGLGAVVNSSRGILYAFGDPGTPDWRDAIAAAARQLRDELNAAIRGGPVRTP